MANQTDKVVGTQTFLGRLRKAYSLVVFMLSYIGTMSMVDTLYYREYMNMGPDAGIGGKVRWPCNHVTMSLAEANNFTVAQ
uniref:Pectinesterase n=1 Tax=Aegilops tauschii TaxID=37682 RepID=R7W8S7_AEGTA